MRFEAWLERFVPWLPDRERTRVLAIAAVVGLAGGLTAIAFEIAMEAVGWLVLGTPDPSVAHIPPARALAGATIAALLAGLAGAQSGAGKPITVADAIEHVRVGGTNLTTRNSAWSAVAALLAIGGGQSSGREGPIVHVSSAVARLVCLRTGLRPQTARSLTAAGAAAGIAASFNSPLGGAFFAMEVLLGTFALDAFAPVVVASVVGTVVGQLVLGDRLVIVVPPLGVASVAELVVFPALGVACGLVTIALRALLRVVPQQLARVPAPGALKPGLLGVFVGMLAAIGLPHVMGNGYALVEEVISDRVQLSIGMLMVVLAAKLLATSLAYGGRSGGGIFAPTLFIGAITGELVGELAQTLAPSLAPQPGIFAVVGMGAVAAAISHNPVTMALMIAEMTGNWALILPLLIAIAIATAIANAADPHSVYVQTLSDRGVRLDQGREELVLRDLRVGDVMAGHGYATVPPDAAFDALAQLFLSQRQDQVFVVEGGYLLGVVDIQDMKGLLHDPGARAGVSARSLARPVPAVRPDQTVADVMEVFFRTGLDVVPVLDDSGRMAGAVYERDVVGALNREILRHDALIARIEGGDAGQRRTDLFELPTGYGLATVDAAGAVGCTLRELDLPRRLGVTVLAVDGWDEKSGRSVRNPAVAGRRIGSRDRLVVMGPVANIDALEARGLDGAPTPTLEPGAGPAADPEVIELGPDGAREPSPRAKADPVGSSGAA